MLSLTIAAVLGFAAGVYVTARTLLVKDETPAFPQPHSKELD